MIRVCAVVVPLIWLSLSSQTIPADAAVASAINLLANPGFEQAGGEGLPAGWDTVVIGAPAQFGMDEAVLRDGRSSLRITTSEIARAYIRSGPIPVAAGETLEAGAWVRLHDVPPDKGTVIVIAEFDSGAGRAEDIKKVGVAEAREGWQLVRGAVQVPAGASHLRLRMGFSYCMGTVWWDDAFVHARVPVSARLDMQDDRLYPASRLPIVILNREERQRPVTVRVDVGGQSHTHALPLDGRPIQQAAVPAAVKTRGRVVVEIRLVDDAGQQVFSSGPVRVMVPPALDLLPPIPTHWVIEDGPPRLAGELELALDEADRQGSEVLVRLLDQQGGERAAWRPSGDAVTAAGLVPFVMHLPDATAGEYRLVAEVRREGRPPITVEQTWAVIPRRQAKVTLNAGGFPEVDGQATFPLGMFNNAGRMEESAAAGFNVVHVYNASRVFPGRRPDDQRLKDVLDRTHQAGMRCLLLVPMAFANSGEWEAFTRRIRMFRNHPGLLAWDEEEGLARGDMKPETLARIRAILREEDPHHPFMVGDARDLITRVTDRSRFFPAEFMDLGMWWWYPFPLRAGPGDDLQGEQGGSGMILESPTFLTQARISQPLWVGLQAYKKPGPTGRYPTPQEYRVQAYLAVIHGAKGLMWYGGSVTGGLFLAPAEGHWEDLKRVVGELAAMSAVLMGDGDPPPEVLPAGSPVAAAIKRGGGRRLLFAANSSYAAADTELVVPGLCDAAVTVFGEDRTVRAAGGRLRDRFEPLAVHVYELDGG